MSQGHQPDVISKFSSSSIPCIRSCVKTLPPKNHRSSSFHPCLCTHSSLIHSSASCQTTSGFHCTIYSSASHLSLFLRLFSEVENSFPAGCCCRCIAERDEGATKSAYKFFQPFPLSLCGLLAAVAAADLGFLGGVDIEAFVDFVTVPSSRDLYDHCAPPP